MATSYSRFTLNDYDRSEIARIRQEAPQLSFEHAQLLHEYRNKSYGITELQSPELRFCEALEDQLARSKAEAVIPLHRANDNGRGPSSFRAPAPEQNKTNEPLTLLDISNWDEVEVPQRDWAVRKVTDKTGTNYAPAKFAAEPEAKVAKSSKEALADAMRRLFTADKIRVQEDGPPSHRRSRLVIVGGVS